MRSVLLHDMMIMVMRMDDMMIMVTMTTGMLRVDMGVDITSF